MDSHTHKRKPLLFSDLFKSHKSMGVQKSDENNSTTSSKSGVSIWTTCSSNRSSSCDDSFSSDYGTPLYSDLGEINGDSFLEEKEDASSDDVDYEENRFVNDDNYSDYDAANRNLGSKLYQNHVGVGYVMPTIQVYELKNQPSISKRNPPLCEKQIKLTESAQQHRGTEWEGRHHRSGMQAVFLGGSGSRNGSSGTGVFLPRVNNNQNESKARSGCSMVLMPTRVVQALDLHFSSINQDSITPPPRGASLYHHSWSKDKPTESNWREKLATSNGEIQLPQEWTY